uniref:golgin subfamily A member 6-like protein 4 isoform X2 n=1 Tax=Epinephelus lanceolatus TaxID=310571 RepID=UPI001446E5E0|nr:golgin subfamily A member 6-like protein 4 isoform X2 [Epinephelus lanceolatus]
MRFHRPAHLVPFWLALCVFAGMAVLLVNVTDVWKLALAGGAFVAAVSFYVYRDKKNKELDTIKQQLQRTEEELRDVKKQNEELEEKVSELNALKQQLQRTEAEKADVMKQNEELKKKVSELQQKLSNYDEMIQKKDNVLDSLKEIRRELENHRGQLLSQLEELERQKKENKEKLQSVDRKITESERERTDEKQRLLKEKQDLLGVKWKLDEHKTEREKLVLHVEQLLQKINTIVSTATEWK